MKGLEPPNRPMPPNQTQPPPQLNGHEKAVTFAGVQGTRDVAELRVTPGAARLLFP